MEEERGNIKEKKRGGGVKRRRMWGEGKGKTNYLLSETELGCTSLSPCLQNSSAEK